MAVVVDGFSDNNHPLDYEFKFVVKKDNSDKSSVDEDVLSSSFSRNGDRWQMQLIKVEGNGDSQTEYNCKLRLIRSTSEWKITLIDYQSSQIQNAIRFTGGSEFTFEEPIHIDQRNGFNLDVEVLEYNLAMPNPKRIIKTDKSTLSAEVLKRFENENFGDVTLVAKDDKKFRCHRDVLARRSEVFRLMFNEASKKVVNLKLDGDYFDGEIVASLLSFIYTDECGNLGPIADRLYSAAHQYKLDRLKNLCETSLAANLSDDTVGETLKLTDLYEDLKKLKAKCVDYLDSRKAGTSQGTKATKVKQLSHGEPMGLTITSKHVRYTTSGSEGFLTDYFFVFAVNRVAKLEKVVLSHDFTHNGDVWQVEVEKCGYNAVRCQLHLINTSSEKLKMACVHIVDTKPPEWDSDDSDDDDTFNYRNMHNGYHKGTTPLALFQHANETYDFGRCWIDGKDAKFQIHLVKWESAETTIEPEPPKPQFATEVLKWFEAENFGDTIMVAKDGKELRCHRDILSARSEFFDRLLSSEWNGARKKVVKIDDFDGEIVAAMLQYFYIDESGNIGPIADRLCVAANQYLLGRLQKLCESVLAARLSPDTVVESYRLAIGYGLDQLKTKCVEYLETHKEALPILKIVLDAMKVESEAKVKRIERASISSSVDCSQSQMDVVAGGTTTDSLQLAYQFEFAIKNGKAVEKDVLFNSFSHQGDLWQLKLKRVEGNSQSQSDFNCKLRLVSSTSERKVAGIVVKRGDVFLSRQVKQSAILFTREYEFDIGTFLIERIGIKIQLDVSEYPDAKLNPKQIIQGPKSTLSAEWLKLFDSADFGDTTVVSADGKEFRCHRDIIRRRRDVFDRMFNCSVKVSNENVINIDGYNGEIVSLLLLFVYTGDCEVLKKIYQLAEFCHMADLMTKLVDFLATPESRKSEKSTDSNAAEGPKAKRPRLAERTGVTITSRLADDSKNDSENDSDSESENDTEDNSDDDNEDQNENDDEDMSENGSEYDDDDEYGSEEDNSESESDHESENDNFRVDYTFGFTVTNIAELGRVVISSPFTHNGNVWQLQVERSGRKNVRCQLHLVDTKSEGIKVACLVHIVGNKYTHAEPSGDELFFGYTRSQSKPDVRKDVIKTTSSALFQHKGDTHDFGTLEIGSDDGDAKIVVQLGEWASAKPTVEREPLKFQMTTEVLKWFEAKDFGDTTLVAADGKKFHCHQDVVSARSEVFDWIFSLGLGETVNVDGYSGEVVAALLQFLYTDECGNIGPIADCLWVAADRYKLDRLKFLCESSLAASLSPDTFVKIFQLANNYHLDQLTAVCDVYLATHKAVLPVADIVFEAMKMGEGNEVQMDQK